MFTMALTKLKCRVETDEIGADEPYAIVWAADVGGLLPTAAANRVGPFRDVDKGETHQTYVAPVPRRKVARIPFWGFDGRPRNITNPDNVIVLAKLIENDQSKTEGIRVAIQTALTASLAALAGSGLPREALVDRLKRDMDAAFKLARPALAVNPNFDDAIGPTMELRVTAADIDAARAAPVEREIAFKGDGGKYTGYFEIRAN